MDIFDATVLIVLLIVVSAIVVKVFFWLTEPISLTDLDYYDEEPESTDE